ncbi:ABC transporter substrate-binding protein [Halobacillus shinanisalinarum]|uniref:ABC transporter substrate-binding protein n=1 Tax=Halobacillus shinanisalinarum TaxID=2932258 RepID=A0ABY4GUI6_9BACI|nr:ABC transporter substrate-binding protein [Halobacillus shinanisalinarum]UOQ91827.1 ABC transporter substrate-binding protein [Halobacillus shinanisalinarum]
MKKLTGLTFIILMMALVACNGESVTDESSSGDGNGSGSKGNELSIWFHFTGKKQESFLEIVDEYNQSQDKYHLKAEYVPFPDVKKQLSIGLAGGTLPDMTTMDVVDNASFAAKGVLADITSRVEEWGEASNFYDGPLQAAMYKGKYYGLPVGSNALGLFYNEDLLAEAGIVEPPSTWDELKEDAKKLKTDNVTPFAISAVKSEEGTFQYYPFLRSSGADFTDLGSEAAKGSMEFLKSLIDEGYMGSYVVNATQDDIARQFASGKIAMMVNGPWNIERLKQDNPDLNFSISQIPKDEEFASVLGGENIAIIKGKNEEGAFDFLTWFLEPERHETFTAETGAFPSRKDVLENSDKWKEDKYLSGFVPIMNGAVPRGPSPEWPSISEAIQVAIQESLTGAKPVGEALDDAAKKVEDIQNN